MDSEFYLYIEKFTAIQNRITQNDKKPKKFGTEHELYQAEIHCIEVIGRYESINASKISKCLSITNGAVTQITDKLISKNLVIKYKNARNKKERLFELTSMGKTAYLMHQKYHEKMYKEIIKYLEGLNDTELSVLKNLMKVIEENL